MGNGVAGGTTIRNVAARARQAGNDAVNVNQMNAAIFPVTNIANAANNPMFHRQTVAVTRKQPSPAARIPQRWVRTRRQRVTTRWHSVLIRSRTVKTPCRWARRVTNARSPTSRRARQHRRSQCQPVERSDQLQRSATCRPARRLRTTPISRSTRVQNECEPGHAKSAYAGIAAATALTMIPDVDQGKTIAVGIGGGSYKGSRLWRSASRAHHSEPEDEGRRGYELARHDGGCGCFVSVVSAVTDGA